MLNQYLKGNERRANFAALVNSWSSETVEENQAAIPLAHDWEPSAQIPTENFVLG